MENETNEPKRIIPNIVKENEYSNDIVYRKWELLKRDLLSREMDQAIEEYVSCLRMNKGATKGTDYYKSGLHEKLNSISSIEDKITEKWNVGVYIPEVVLDGDYPHGVKPFWTITNGNAPFKVQEATRIQRSGLFNFPDEKGKWVYLDNTSLLPIVVT